ncbi:MAG: restriction endonuclease [Anaerolineae bacterium]|nr:restriction endonuclease [Anaerolineae bacterium]
MTRPTHAWMVRAGNENELADVVEKESVVAIGWDKVGDISNLETREQFKERYREAYPEDSSNRVAVNAGQVYRFVREIQEGHYVLTYIKTSREMLIGLVKESYEYRAEAYLDHYPHVRQVQWLVKVSRDDFGPQARNSMGSTLTVFNLDDYLDQIHSLATGEEVGAPDEEEEAPPFYEEVKARADELIADTVSHLDPYDFQDLEAALLRALGFRAVSASPGPDRGVDIVAHPDPLGFERPRIKAQVKHRQGAAGGPEIRAFIATLRDGENGLYVSTGGFTRDAEVEARGAREPVTLLDRDAFIRLFLEHYEDLEPEYKAQVPLRRVWVPAE